MYLGDAMVVLCHVAIEPRKLPMEFLLSLWREKKDFFCSLCFQFFPSHNLLFKMFSVSFCLFICLFFLYALVSYYMLFVLQFSLFDLLYLNFGSNAGPAEIREAPRGLCWTLWKSAHLCAMGWRSRCWSENPEQAFKIWHSMQRKNDCQQHAACRFNCKKILRSWNGYPRSCSGMQSHDWRFFYTVKAT